MLKSSRFINAFVVIVVLIPATTSKAIAANASTTTTICHKKNAENRISIYENYYEHNSLYFSLAKFANEQNITNALCTAQLKEIQKNVLQCRAWAMKVLEASGNKALEFMSGNNFWLGDQNLCNTVNAPLDNDFGSQSEYALLSNDVAPFDVDYRIVYLQHNSTHQLMLPHLSRNILHVGLCVPSVCSLSDVEQLMREYVNEGLLLENEIYDMQLQVIYAKNLKLSKEFLQKKSLNAVLIFISFSLIATLIAVIVNESNVKEEQSPQPMEQKKSLIRSFIKCFDMRREYQKLWTFATTTSGNELAIISGLHSICALVLVLCHALYFIYNTVDNFPIFFWYVETCIILADVLEAVFAVSGFLHVYNFLRNKRQLEVIRQNSLCANIGQFFKMFLRRYLRLTPLHLLIVGMTDVTYAYMNEVSVYHSDEAYRGVCSNYGWLNFFYLQNFLDLPDQCVVWTWSIACDIQFYTVASILLLIYAKHPKCVKNFTFLLLIGSILLTYFLSLSQNYLLNVESYILTLRVLYFNPFVRVTSYIIGALAAGYVLQKSEAVETRTLGVKHVWSATIILLAACSCCWSSKTESSSAAAIIGIAARVLIALHTSWMIIQSLLARQKTSWWIQLLQAQFLQHFNRLYYAINLLNPLVITFFINMMSISTHVNIFLLLIYTAGFICMVYLMALVFMLFFELPFRNVSSLLLK